MTTSGTVAFLPDLSECTEEAFEQCGLEVRSGYDVRSARRSMNLLTLEWANYQVNLWAIEEVSLPLVQGTATYTLAADTIDLLDVVIRTTNTGVQSDLSIGRLSLGDYTTIPTKLSQGRPVQFFVQRSITPTVTVWPVPDGAQYTMVYWRLRRIQDAGSSGEITLDVPVRFIPAFIAGLAYHIACKKAPLRMVDVKARYDELFNKAINEDRERASFSVVPKFTR